MGQDEVEDVSEADGGLGLRQRLTEVLVGVGQRMHFEVVTDYGVPGGQEVGSSNLPSPTKNMQVRRVRSSAEGPPGALLSMPCQCSPSGGPHGDRHRPRSRTNRGHGASYAWVDVDNWISTWELKVTDAAEDLAERYLALGDLDGAVWAARRGLNASQTHSRLEFLQGGLVALEDAIGSSCVALGEVRLDQELGANSTTSTLTSLSSIRALEGLEALPPADPRASIRDSGLSFATCP